MAKVQFQVLDPTARRAGMRVLCTEEWPEIDDAVEAVAALAAICGVSFDEEGRPVIDPDRAKQINPGGRLCRLVIDVRSR